MLTTKSDAVQQQVADIAALKSPYEGVSMRVDDAVRREALRPVDSVRTTFVAAPAAAPATPTAPATLDDFSRANVEAVFNRGIALARDLPSTKDAKLTIGFRALDTDAGIRPSEYQYIYATDVEGVVHNLGSILPEKKSGKLLHSPEEIAAKIDTMVKKYVESTK